MHIYIYIYIYTNLCKVLNIVDVVFTTSNVFLNIYTYIYIYIYSCKNCRQGTKKAFYTKAFRICSSEYNYSTEKNKFVAFTK